MRQIIQQITQNLTDRLPENDQYYRLEELRSWGFPSFIVRRIRVELKRNLSESMIIPKTDWANTQADAVLDAWQQFIDAIRDEARLPASYGQAVIETAVSDVVEMLVQPRKNVPEVIFGTKDELPATKVMERLEGIVIYRHFAVLISRYLEKKNLETLSKKRCRSIITKADEKLTAGYSPLNWAQLLEPLFQLVDDGIDTNLLRLFYEDKNMPRIAKKIDLMNTTLSRAEFIETLSSPDLLNFEGYEDDQSSLFEDQPAEEKNEVSVTADIEEMDENNDSSESDGDGSPANNVPSEDYSPGNNGHEEEENTLNTVFKDEDTSKQEFADEEKEVISDENDVDTSDEQEEDIGDQEHSDGVSEDEEEEKENAAELNVSSPDEVQNNDIELEERVESGEEDSGETPIWMRFMSDEEIEEYQKEQEAELDEDGFIDEPIIDLTQEDASEKEIKQLMDILEKDRQLFVDEIFRGSDRAFDQAVEDIAAYDSWRDVSKYIEKDIFKRNLVDMYSEAAVDFTDQLQSYFLEKQNRNKQEN
ncbi:hypothetical protein [Fodinibius sp. Rm-B-1B1-1]|uniref:hypothetical protein n=1 Tax=Fodinibius alkaliphilus TaxID=3140241 RepID=UPI00315B313D